MARTFQRSALCGFRGLAAAVALLAVLVACGGGGGEGSEAGAQIEERDPNDPGVWEVGPNRYEAVIVAFEGGFDPSEIRVPLGSEVTFRARSVDLVHGLAVEGTEVELQLEPREWVQASHTFTEAGEYRLLCHIYCGGGHPAMLGSVVVE